MDLLSELKELGQVVPARIEPPIHYRKSPCKGGPVLLYTLDSLRDQIIGLTNTKWRGLLKAKRQAFREAFIRARGQGLV